MTVLLLGSTGMLGHEIKQAHPDWWAPSKSELDLLTQDWTTFEKRPDFVVNCAAFTAVDAAESQEAEAMALNAAAVGRLAEWCHAEKISLIHISTDFVFDGSSATAYVETDATAPLGVYGKSKLLGEQLIAESGCKAWVIRTSWLYGPKGKSFPRTILGAWDRGVDLKVVNDQTGCPTDCKTVVAAVTKIVETTPEPGVYHIAGPEAMTWHEFAVKVIAKAEDFPEGSIRSRIKAIPTSEYPTPAVRPKNSVLNCAKAKQAGIYLPTPIDEAIEAFTKAI